MLWAKGNMVVNGLRVENQNCHVLALQRAEKQTASLGGLRPPPTPPRLNIEGRFSEPGVAVKYGRTLNGNRFAEAAGNVAPRQQHVLCRLPRPGQGRGEMHIG